MLLNFALVKLTCTFLNSTFQLPMVELTFQNHFPNLKLQSTF